MEVDKETIDEFQIKVIDFDATYGHVISRVICKDCKNGQNIVAHVSVDVRGYARIVIFCDIHGEWEPCVISSQAGLLGEVND